MEIKLWTIAMAEIPDHHETFSKIESIAEQYGGSSEIWHDTFDDDGDSEGRIYHIKDEHTDEVEAALTALGINVFAMMAENF